MRSGDDDAAGPADVDGGCGDTDPRRGRVAASGRPVIRVAGPAEAEGDGADPRRGRLAAGRPGEAAVVRERR